MRCPACCGTGPSHNEDCLAIEQRPVPAESMPAFEPLPGEVPQVSADATLTLPIDIYAPWMNAIKRWLEQAGAANGRDWRASVAAAGYDSQRRALWRVKWRSLTPKGVLYLNLMAGTLRLLEQEAKALPEPRKDAENGGF